jgi:hypothetical protein
MKVWANLEMERCREFWVGSKHLLPNLFDVVRHIVVCPTSSASVERVFSILNQSLGNQQTASLEDYISTSLMYQYNEREC